MNFRTVVLAVVLVGCAAGCRTYHPRHYHVGPVEPAYVAPAPVYVEPASTYYTMPVGGYSSVMYYDDPIPVGGGYRHRLPPPSSHRRRHEKGMRGRDPEPRCAPAAMKAAKTKRATKAPAKPKTSAPAPAKAKTVRPARPSSPSAPTATRRQRTSRKGR